MSWEKNYFPDWQNIKTDDNKREIEIKDMIATIKAKQIFVIENHPCKE